MFPKMVTEKGEAEIAASANQRGTSGCVVSDVRRAHHGCRKSQFAGDQRDDGVAADDDVT